MLFLIFTFREPQGDSSFQMLMLEDQKLSDAQGDNQL